MNLRGPGPPPDQQTKAPRGFCGASAMQGAICSSVTTYHPSERSHEVNWNRRVESTFLVLNEEPSCTVIGLFSVILRT
jgi:hypothetical protein